MQLNMPTAGSFISLSIPPCSNTHSCTQCGVEICLHAKKILEATHLIQLGARAALVRQLTGLEKHTANQLYQQIHGKPSSPGQVPFMDSWHRKSDRHMLHTNIVWQLHKKLSHTHRSKARALIDVFETYRQVVAAPLLDLARTAFVQQLITMDTWHERKCESCGMGFTTPIESNSKICPGCLLYHRHRCIQCGTALSPKAKGRGHANCTHCGCELIGGIRH